MKEELQSELRTSAVPQLYQKTFQPNSSECKNHGNAPHQCWGASGSGSHPLSLGVGVGPEPGLDRTFLHTKGQAKANSGPKLRTLRVNP